MRHAISALLKNRSGVWFGPLSVAQGRAELGDRRGCLSVCLHCLSTFGAEEWLALGPGPHKGVVDVRESHLGHVPSGLDRPVSGASPGLGLDFCGHDLPPMPVGTAA